MLDATQQILHFFLGKTICGNWGFTVKLIYFNIHAHTCVYFVAVETSHKLFLREKEEKGRLWKKEICNFLDKFYKLCEKICQQKKCFRFANFLLP